MKLTLYFINILNIQLKDSFNMKDCLKEQDRLEIFDNDIPIKERPTKNEKKIHCIDKVNRYNKLILQTKQTLNKIKQEQMVVIWSGESGSTVWYSPKDQHVYSYWTEYDIFFVFEHGVYMRSKLHYKQWIEKSKKNWEMM